MASKNFIPNAASLVDGMCMSLLAGRSELKYDRQHKVVFVDQSKSKNGSHVTLISGGGSGHEPAHAGYVGAGMLDAAVCGAIFASPNVKQISSGLGHIKSDKGTLVIVKNYTGDKLNFGLAVEEFRAKTRSKIEMVMVEDDVAVSRSRGSKVGRRGLAGTIFVHKVAGAASQRGYSLSEVTKLAQHVTNNIGTIGASLDHCSVPGQSESVSLGDNEIELGMGIHNEPGVRKISPQPDMQSLVEQMLNYLLDPNDQDRAFLEFETSPAEAKLCLLINNLGGLSILEISAITNVVLETLASTYNIKPVRLYVGSLLTSLDGPGFSISLLNAESKHGSPSTEQLMSLLDDPTEALGWPFSNKTDAIILPDAIVTNAPSLPTQNFVNIPCNRAVVVNVLQAVYHEVEKAESSITEYDTIMGDGDCGTTLLAGAKTLLDLSQNLQSDNLSTIMTDISVNVRDAMGGTSGALYGIFLGSFATALQESYETCNDVSISLFASAAAKALETLERFTAARKGSRTLMDALIPFVDTLRDASAKESNAASVLTQAIQAASLGVENTKQISSSFGRSTYVGADSTLGNAKTEDPTAGIPDPGACGIVAVATGILNGLQ